MQVIREQKINLTGSVATIKNEELTLEGIRQFFVNTERIEYKFDTICDLYEKKYKTNIFEPKLEREIFDHIYLFYEKNNIDNHEKSWKLFTPLIKNYLT